MTNPLDFKGYFSIEPDLNWTIKSTPISNSLYNNIKHVSKSSNKVPTLKFKYNSDKRKHSIFLDAWEIFANQLYDLLTVYYLKSKQSIYFLLKTYDFYKQKSFYFLLIVLWKGEFYSVPRVNLQIINKKDLYIQNTTVKVLCCIKNKQNSDGPFQNYYFVYRPWTIDFRPKDNFLTGNGAATILLEAIYSTKIQHDHEIDNINQSNNNPNINKKQGQETIIAKKRFTEIKPSINEITAKNQVNKISQSITIKNNTNPEKSTQAIGNKVKQLNVANGEYFLKALDRGIPKDIEKYKDDSDERLEQKVIQNLDWKKNLINSSGNNITGTLDTGDPTYVYICPFPPRTTIVRLGDDSITIPAKKMDFYSRPMTNYNSKEYTAVLTSNKINETQKKPINKIKSESNTDKGNLKLPQPKRKKSFFDACLRQNADEIVPTINISLDKPNKLIGHSYDEDEKIPTPTSPKNKDSNRRVNFSPSVYDPGSSRQSSFGGPNRESSINIIMDNKGGILVGTGDDDNNLSPGRPSSKMFNGRKSTFLSPQRHASRIGPLDKNRKSTINIAMDGKGQVLIDSDEEDEDEDMYNPEPRSPKKSMYSGKKSMYLSPQHYGNKKSTISTDSNVKTKDNELDIKAKDSSTKNNHSRKSKLKISVKDSEDNDQYGTPWDDLMPNPADMKSPTNQSRPSEDKTSIKVTVRESEKKEGQRSNIGNASFYSPHTSHDADSLASEVFNINRSSVPRNTNINPTFNMNGVQVGGKEMTLRTTSPNIININPTMTIQDNRSISQPVEPYNSTPININPTFNLVDNNIEVSHGNSTTPYPDYVKINPIMSNQKNRNNSPSEHRPASFASQSFSIARIKSRVSDQITPLSFSTSLSKSTLLPIQDNYSHKSNSDSNTVNVNPTFNLSDNKVMTQPPDTQQQPPIININPCMNIQDNRSDTPQPSVASPQSITINPSFNITDNKTVLPAPQPIPRPPTNISINPCMNIQDNRNNTPVEKSPNPPQNLHLNPTFNITDNKTTIPPAIMPPPTPHNITINPCMNIQDNRNNTPLPQDPPPPQEIFVNPTFTLEDHKSYMLPLPPPPPPPNNINIHPCMNIQDNRSNDPLPPDPPQPQEIYVNPSFTIEDKKSYMLPPPPPPPPPNNFNINPCLSIQDNRVNTPKQPSPQPQEIIVNPVFTIEDNKNIMLPPPPPPPQPNNITINPCLNIQDNRNNDKHTPIPPPNINVYPTFVVEDNKIEFPKPTPEPQPILINVNPSMNIQDNRCSPCHHHTPPRPTIITVNPCMNVEDNKEVMSYHRPCHNSPVIMNINPVMSVVDNKKVPAYCPCPEQPRIVNINPSMVVHDNKVIERFRRCTPPRPSNIQVNPNIIVNNNSNEQQKSGKKKSKRKRSSKSKGYNSSCCSSACESRAHSSCNYWPFDNERDSSSDEDASSTSSNSSSCCCCSCSPCCTPPCHDTCDPWIDYFLIQSQCQPNSHWQTQCAPHSYAMQPFIDYCWPRGPSFW